MDKDAQVEAEELRQKLVLLTDPRLAPKRRPELPLHCRERALHVRPLVVVPEELLSVRSPFARWWRVTGNGSPTDRDAKCSRAERRLITSAKFTEGYLSDIGERPSKK